MQKLAANSTAVLVHFFRFAPTAIKQDCGSRDARLGRRGRFHHDSGQRFDGRVCVCSGERFDVSEVFWRFPLSCWSAHQVVAEPRAEGGLLAPALNHSTFRRA